MTLTDCFQVGNSLLGYVALHFFLVLHNLAVISSWPFSAETQAVPVLPALAPGNVGLSGLRIALLGRDQDHVLRWLPNIIPGTTKHHLKF